MTKTRARPMTELEGAILGVLRAGGAQSAYRIRQVFLTSRSAEWSGSAGAVYPALRRLKAAGLLGESREKDGRGTTAYSLSAEGCTGHDRWLCDVERALSPGLDPFRTRAHLWKSLAPAKRQALFRTLRKAIEIERESLLRSLPQLDSGDTVTAGLLLSLADLRLAWLKRA